MARLTDRLNPVDCTKATLGYLTKNQVLSNLLPITGLHRPIQGMAATIHRFDPVTQVELLTGLIWHENAGSTEIDQPLIYHKRPPIITAFTLL